jgi:hypothetical protein
MTDSFEDRWLVVISEAISPQALDWIERQVERTMIETPQLRQAIDAKRKEIEGA